ncbi:MAG: hypothetical protein HFG31_09785, partial [Eubacterium sp.]|nr:hypothetical protein [Eubacterium sp.]
VLSLILVTALITTGLNLEAMSQSIYASQTQKKEISDATGYYGNHNAAVCGYDFSKHHFGSFNKTTMKIK